MVSVRHYLERGNTLLQASFSREMEREADAYARDALRGSLGTSPAELGYALEALSHSTNEASEYLNQVLNYLSTHPRLMNAFMRQSKPVRSGKN